MAQRIGRDSSGVFIIAATPFTDNGEIDHDSLRRLVDFYAGHGVTGLTILGMMGEANKMTPEERRAVIPRGERRPYGGLRGRGVVVGRSGQSVLTREGAHRRTAGQPVEASLAAGRGGQGRRAS